MVGRLRTSKFGLHLVYESGRNKLSAGLVYDLLRSTSEISEKVFKSLG